MNDPFELPPVGEVLGMDIPVDAPDTPITFSGIDIAAGLDLSGAVITKQ